MKSAASVGIEAANRIAIAEGAGRMIAGTSEQLARPLPRSPAPRGRTAIGGRRSARRRGVMGNAMRRSATGRRLRSKPTSAAESAAAANSAAQICTVWP